jgi:integrase
MGVKIREKKPGEWWIFVNHKGRRTSRKVGSAEAARETAKMIEAKLTLKEFVVEAPNRKEDQAPTYQEYATLWLDGQIKAVRRVSTYTRYKEALTRHIFPAIGRIGIDQVGRKDIKRFLLGYYQKSKSKKAVTLMRDICNGPFAAAVDEGLIQASPVTGVLGRLNIRAGQEGTADPLTAHETVLFLETCQKHYPDHYPFFLTLFRTGLRVGEALALRWSDLDWNGRFIQVSRSYRRQEFSGTKTGKTRRVDMSKNLFETLQNIYTRHKREALGAGRKEMDGIIFHNGKGSPRGQNSVRYIFKEILRKAGLREIRIHDTRHSYASQLLSDGVTPVYVKEQLGHHSIEITVDTYGHWIPSGDQEAVNRLDHLAEKCTQSAPSPHPAKNKSGQDIDIPPAFIDLVPKGGLEPPQAFAY